MAFWQSSALRLITTGETDYNGPIPEETYSQFRENNEALTMLTFNSTFYGTCSGVSSSGWVKAKTPGFGIQADSSLNNFTLAILSGTARGNIYQINKSSSGAAANAGRVKCSDPHGDGLSTDDSVRILYTIKKNSSQRGHQHDGEDSPLVVLGNAQVANVKLNTATAKSTGSIVDNALVSMAINEYAFFPKLMTGQVAWGATPQVILQTGATAAAEYTPYLGLRNPASSGQNNGYHVNWRYVTASNNPFQYILRDPDTKEIVHRWSGDDPPGNLHYCTTKPSSFVPPILVHNGKGDIINDQYEEIVCFGYDREHWVNLMRSATSKSKSDVIANRSYDTELRQFTTTKRKNKW